MHTQPSPQPDELDLDLTTYLVVIWDNRIRLVVAAFVTAVVAVVYSALIPRVYEAEASMALSRSKMVEGPADTTAVGNFIPLLENRAVAAQVIKEFGLADPPYNASPTTFFDSMVTIEEVRNSTVVRIHGRFRDPVLAANVVNRVADLGSEAVRLASQQEALQARDYIKQQRDEARQRVAETTENLRKFRDTSQLELQKRDVDGALAERAGLLRLQIQIETEKSHLASAEKELAARKRVQSVQRSIEDDPLLAEAARTKSGGGSVLPLRIETEVLNPVFAVMDEDVAKTRTRLASLERQRAQMGSRNLDGPELAQLKRMYLTEAEQNRLQTEADLADKIYQQMATSYETSRLTVVGRSSALQVLSHAVTPDRPEPRGLARTGLAWAVVGLVMATVVMLTVHSVRRKTGRPAV